MSKKKIAILQSNYIPWKGYFDLISSVDEFILYDDMQYTRRDWRNRNLIKTPQGVMWLTVPVKVKGKYDQKIRDTHIDGEDWALTHWRAMLLNYKKAPYFDEIAEWLRPIYLEQKHIHLSDLNRLLIESVCGYLKIETKISNSWDYGLTPGKTERLADLCSKAGGTEYISGPSAKNYLDEKVFHKKKIEVTWFNYENYPVYQQLWGGFVHGVSILDMIFNCGKTTTQYMRFLK